MESPSEKFEIDPRADIVSKVRIVVGEAQKGPETLELTWARVGGKRGDFAYWTMTPMQRELSYEAEAKLRGPRNPGRYILHWRGTYSLRGPDGKTRDLGVDSNPIDFTVRK